jgi:hypothetical protein
MSSSENFLLSPLDQLMPITYTRIFLTFATDDRKRVIEALGNGPRELCNQLPYLKGRVGTTTEQKGHFSISWSKEDADPSFQEVIPTAKLPTYALLKSESPALPSTTESQIDMEQSTELEELRHLLREERREREAERRAREETERRARKAEERARGEEPDENYVSRVSGSMLYCQGSHPKLLGIPRLREALRLGNAYAS